MSLVGKVALVTGAASGIGEECAKMLAKDGAAVVIADLNLDGAKVVAQSIIDAGGKAMAVSMNVTSEDEVNAGIKQAVDTFGSIDILVSNAGIQIVHPIEEYPFEDWKKMMAIHGDGAFLTTKAAYKYMKDAGRGGKIIYMGSVHSHEASKLKSAYVFAKHGLLGLARVIAKEGGPFKIHSYVVCPGYVLTPLVQKQIPEQAAALHITEEEVVKNVMLKETVDGEFTTTVDVANLVTYLANDTGALTGQSINVSHGWSMI
ncbi:3-hydroxybutyrate dehydrogenase [Hydromonas duriensis]|uniref:3-hydroxybutyrate dehydrogenase n=1 Tax=Hydromonas duriensis TaxID=1527608 RepID=A0A4R6Y6C7_9BURK|nr:3-hydroxybutyrate dehydrogenase [Hydromonas duriensis]TDR30919.1 3-hydroxybutyrate dehydrogenase [Hydromonas duriensis]